MKQHRSGQSIIELLMAVAIMVIVMTSSAGIMSLAEKNVDEMSRHLQAIVFAEEGVQAVISIADRSWNEIAVGVHGLAIDSPTPMWIFQGTSDVMGEYTRTVTISTVDSDTKKIVIVVTWYPESNRTATVEQQLLLTDWAFI